MEDAPGRHATGRSAALFTEYYGNAVVRSLTRASRDFFLDPPAGFAQTPLVTPRGTLALCPPGSEEAFEESFQEGLEAREPVRELTDEEVLHYCPVVRTERFTRAMLRPATMDIDTDALHQGFLRGVRAAGGHVVVRAHVRALEHRAGSWHASTDAGEFSAPIVLDAAGAWADKTAALAGAKPIGLHPLRRTAFLVDAPGEVNHHNWPMVIDVNETFYVKPESGMLLISPADATPSPPKDARPNDIDVALGVERVEAATTLRIRSVRKSWAGLRSFVTDGTPVVGPASAIEGFFWFAALGGYGLQMSPALGRLVAKLTLGEQPSDLGFDLSLILADRLSK
jgi:D-arginine dehydrogenase